jgi:hypothetical protein
MKIRILKGAASVLAPGIVDAEPCNHLNQTPHATVDLLGGSWCVYPHEYEVIADEQPSTQAAAAGRGR